MTVKEYRKAVKSAKRVFASVYIAGKGRARQCRISKVWAINIIAGLNGTDTVKAEWLTDEHKFLMVG